MFKFYSRLETRAERRTYRRTDRRTDTQIERQREEQVLLSKQMDNMGKEALTSEYSALKSLILNI